MNKTAALFALGCLVASPAWAVNKCTIDGKTVFQDAACPGKGEAIKVRPASGASRATVADTNADPSKKPQTEAQRLEANIEASQRERRLREINERGLPGADQAVRNHLAFCQEEHTRLERSKGAFVQNLYGKTDAAQKAAEQAALASRCDTKDRELRATAASLRAECQQLGGCK